MIVWGGYQRTEHSDVWQYDGFIWNLLLGRFKPYSNCTVATSSPLGFLILVRIQSDWKRAMFGVVQMIPEKL